MASSTLKEGVSKLKLAYEGKALKLWILAIGLSEGK
jgi:hypothetical protein